MAALAATLALSSCGSIGDLDVKPRSDSRTFGLTGKTLVVESGSNLRLEAADGPELTVDRDLTGQAAEDGNASWELSGDRLKLTAKCSGMVLNCSSEYTVKVPSGVAVTVVTTGADVLAEGLANALTATTGTGAIRVERSSGTLRLSSGTGRVVVRDAGSAHVDVRSDNADHTLSFSKAPSRVSSRTKIGDIKLTLPKDNTRYAIDGKAEDGEKYRIKIPNTPDAAHKVTVESPRGRVLVTRES
ncbi:DUF4097 family beta strand repeat-containing protein [Streptomyces sp. NPDC057552]|uniref:DUF4097 family beta strand repeat-containing protein n=1 Tax=Streptomyces sp. NPDC057552 TaxID=3350537 RepID=UPI003675BD44